ncbi:hypothetical protein GA565_08100 [Rouxiella sp. S1S-2]|uniref:hypothetical protein n=1 Tax=Rouxiella sp. S1S-2 TaxID=2653856 RepID=UPI001264733B|nr:hypothetical protein [Rouxiella sp. S1S-2]KAB7895951.1 hypothetical protein GA565_08100 [Rouxiella sp. S1S-2]
MKCDCIVFGHGYNGAVLPLEWQGERFVEFYPSPMTLEKRLKDTTKKAPQLQRKEKFLITRHLSRIDNYIYLLAHAEDEHVEDIDIHILMARPRPKPLSFED